MTVRLKITITMHACRALKNERRGEIGVPKIGRGWKRDKLEKMFVLPIISKHPTKFTNLLF